MHLIHEHFWGYENKNAHVWTAYSSVAYHRVLYVLPECVYMKVTLVHCTHRNFYHGLKIEMEKDLVDMGDGWLFAFLFYYLCHIDKYNQRK